MKKITLEIEYDDTNGYKGHGDDTIELIIQACKNEIEVGLEHDGVIKEGWKITLIEQK